MCCADIPLEIKTGFCLIASVGFLAEIEKILNMFLCSFWKLRPAYSSGGITTWSKPLFGYWQLQSPAKCNAALLLLGAQKY
jgi:hypothetical protein